MEDTISDMEFGTKQYAYFVSVLYYQNLPKGRKLRNRKQNTRQHWIRMRENGSSLDFNFISLLNPAVDKNWVYRHHLLQFFLERMMFRSIQTFSVTSKFTEHYHIFCARIDLLFTIFVCSRYSLWATIRLLHNFGFVMCVNCRLNCTNFLCRWRKIRNVSRRLTQISKRQHDPWNI